MTNSSRRALLALIAASPVLPLAAHAAPRAPMLANLYRPGLALADYWVSEKYDGVRALWDGRQLWTRHGHRIAAPTWFTAAWPAHALDGELWAGAGRFTVASAAAARTLPDDAQWKRLRYMAFDLPDAAGPFDERLPRLRALDLQVDGTLQAVTHRRLASEADLHALLARTVRAGGEGLMLRRGASPYRSDRSDDLLKLKQHLDAEAEVIGHVPGKGRHEGRLGALLVRTPEGVRFRIGTGFTDADRRDPPPVGSEVTYQYSGVHPGGAPRFASYLRVRTD